MHSITIIYFAFLRQLTQPTQHNKYHYSFQSSDNYGGRIFPGISIKNMLFTPTVGCQSHFTFYNNFPSWYYFSIVPWHKGKIIQTLHVFTISHNNVKICIKMQNNNWKQQLLLNVGNYQAQGNYSYLIIFHRVWFSFFYFNFNCARLYLT